MPDWSSNPAVLQRFGSHFPQQSFPADFESWRTANTSDAIRLQENDPDLFRLMQGTAPAGAVAEALQGSFSPVPPDVAQMKAEAQKARLAELRATNPYAKESRNLTAQAEIAMLDPEGHAKAVAEATPKINVDDQRRMQMQAAVQEQEEKIRSMQVATSVRYYNPGPMKSK